MDQCVIKTELRDITLSVNTLECLDNETLFAWCEDSTDPLVRVLVNRLHRMNQYMDDEIADQQGEQDERVLELESDLEDVQADLECTRQELEQEIEDLKEELNQERLNQTQD